MTNEDVKAKLIAKIKQLKSNQIIDILKKSESNENLTTEQILVEGFLVEEAYKRKIVDVDTCGEIIWL